VKGVLLCGGKGTRLGELTKVTNKHLLPVGDMPMVYYPLKKLVGAGITDIMLITGTEHMGAFVELLGSGKQHGCQLTYRVQDEAGGIAQALGLAEGFCRGERLTVVLGDNIFEDAIPPDYPDYGCDNQAVVYLKSVDDPQRYGVADICTDESKSEYGKILWISEKPERPKTHWAVSGLYVYPPDVFDIIRRLKPSNRGELEITDVNNAYCCQRPGRLAHGILRGYWTDAGTHESLAVANELVRNTPPRF